MPRGGRRPGAGAPKGNKNAISIEKVYARALVAQTLFQQAAPELRLEFQRAAREAGVLVRDPTVRTPRGNRAAANFAYDFFIARLIDRQSNSITDNQPNQTPEATPPGPPAAPDSPAPKNENPA